MSLKISRLPLASHTQYRLNTHIFPKSKSFYLLVASTSTRICTERWRFFFQWKIHEVHQEDLRIEENKNKKQFQSEPESAKRSQRSRETENAAGWFKGKTNKIEYVIKLNYDNCINLKNWFKVQLNGLGVDIRDHSWSLSSGVWVP